jgi:hypothetical protein
MRTLLLLVLALSLPIGAGEARAQGQEDHLQCFKVTNDNLKKLKGVVDLDAPGIGVAPGCKLGKATHYCVPARSEVQPGTLFDGKIPLEPDPFETAPIGEGRICYKVACPKEVSGAPDQLAQDPYGVHEFTKLRTQMICAPATPPPASAFRIVTPEIQIEPLQEISYCYYFRTSNNVTAAIRRFSSEKTAVIRQAVFFTTENQQGEPVDRQAPGTVSAANCGILVDNQAVPRWVYAAHDATEELVLPPDDGTGKPLAIEVAANAAGFLMLHAFNPTEEPAIAQITIEAQSLEPGTEYTETATFATWNASISLPAFTNGTVETQSCPAPAGASFWRLTTNSHKQSVLTQVRDGATVLFQGTNWEAPGAQLFSAAPFATFSTGQLTYECTYDNPTNRTITSGESFAVDEACMAVGYFFPATGPQVCYDGFLVF